MINLKFRTADGRIRTYDIVVAKDLENRKTTGLAAMDLLTALAAEKKPR